MSITSLFLIDVLSINSRGQLTGDAIQMSTGDGHAYLANPENSATIESATGSAEGVVTEHPKIVLPENVRRALQQRLHSRYHASVLGAPRE